MKRFLSLTLALLIVMTMAACGGSGGKAADPNTLVVWHDKEAAVIDALQAYLDKALPDITVRFEKKTSLTDSLKLVGNDPSSAPDLFVFAHDKIGVFAEMGILTPVTELISQSELSGYLPMTLEAATYNFVEQHSTAYYSAAWIHGFGGSIIDADGTPFPDQQAVKDALEYHLKFVDLMPGETEYSTVNTLFLEGKADATIGGPWMVPSAREANIDLGIASMPTVDKTGRALAPYSGVQGIHVLTFAAQNKTDAVQRLLHALLDPEVGVVLAQASGCAPVNSACYDDSRVCDDTLVQAMRTTAEIAVPMPNIPEMDVMWTVVGNLQTDVNLSKSGIDKAFAAALTQANSLIDAMH